MLALWWLGQPVEAALGRARFLLLYFVAGLAGSAGALLLTPNAVTVGASGAIFGILGALLVLEYQATGSLAGQAMTLIVINLAFSFAFARTSRSAATSAACSPGSWRRSRSSASGRTVPGRGTGRARPRRDRRRDRRGLGR